MTEALSTFRFRGRCIGSEELTDIRKALDTHWHKGRGAISRELCRQWQWIYPHGGLKDQYCRMLLVRLERAGHITLPPRLRPDNNKNRKRLLPEPELFLPSRLEGRLGEVGPVTIVRVSTPVGVRQWWVPSEPIIIWVVSGSLVPSSTTLLLSKSN